MLALKTQYRTFMVRMRLQCLSFSLTSELAFLVALSVASIVGCSPQKTTISAASTLSGNGTGGTSTGASGGSYLQPEPDAFTFVPVTGAALGTEVTSNAVTLSGFTGLAAAACVGCSHIVRNGVVNGNTAAFLPGDTIALQVLSDTSADTVKTAYVVVGSTTSGVFSVRTTDNTPSAFSFTNQTGVFTGVPITSNTVTLGGTFTNVTATCGAGCVAISKNGTSFLPGPVSGFNSGDTIAIKQTSSSSSNTATTATVIVGSTTSSTWQVTTTTDACADTIPSVGTMCADGTIYAGLTPDGNVKMFTTKCDAGLLKGDGSCETDRASNVGVKKNWSSIGITGTGINPTSTGRSNTNALYAMIGNPSHGNFEAAKYCYELVQDGHDDWYLPAIDELDLLYDGHLAIDNFEISSGDFYWSSSENPGGYPDTAVSQRMTDGSVNLRTGKPGALWVRCVRSEGASSAPTHNGALGPNDFNFNATTGAALSTEVTSNTVTLTGLTNMVFAACVSCTHIIRNGVVNGNTSIFMPGDTIALQMMSSPTANTATYAYVIVGNTTSGTWSVTTSSNTPNAFSFTNQSNVTTGVAITSNTVTLGGTFTNVTATCGTGCIGISKNGGAFVPGPVTGFSSGNTIAIKQTSSSSSNTATSATVVVGSTTSSSWQVTTTTDACADTIPNVGTVCADGTIYGGLTPDGNVKMFTTKCDAGLLKGDGSCETDRASNSGAKKNWSSLETTSTGIRSTSSGRTNTAALYALIGNPSHGNFEAAKYCYELIQNGHDDWYLPARDELDVLYDGRLEIGNFESSLGQTYITSTEAGSNLNWAERFTDGYQANPAKSQAQWLRCVRSEGASSAPTQNGALGPNDFGFTATTGAALSTEVTSQTVTLSGLTAMVFAACVDCTHIIRNGVVNGNTSIFMPGDTIALQMMSSSTPNTSTYAYVIVGNTTSGTWSVTTSNNTPTAFSFINQNNVNTSAPITSNTVTLAGTFTNVSATCGTGCIGISKNGASFTAGPVTGLSSGDTITIKQTSSGISNTSTTASVVVGSTTSSLWQVTTSTDPCADTIPAVGTICADGTIYAGLTPDGNVKMFTTKCDAGLLKGDGSCETDRVTNAGVKKNWSSYESVATGLAATSTGQSNTVALYALVGSPSHGNFESAKYCTELIQNGHDDWYLPALDELDLLYDNRIDIGEFDSSGGQYWASTEFNWGTSYNKNFSNGSVNTGGKSELHWVRCVRKN